MPTLKRKFIAHVAPKGKNVKKFEKTVNNYLARGWELVTIDMHCGLSGRTLCSAVVAIPERCTCACGGCTGETAHDADCTCDYCVLYSEQAQKNSAPEPD